MKLKPNICLVVIGQTINQFLKNLKTAQTQADLVELRVDFIKNLNMEDLCLIKQRTHKVAIFTCRPQSSGGHFNNQESNRLNLIKRADSLGFDFIDLELETLITKPLNLKHSKLIISHHNFKTTPSIKKLNNILTQMNSFKPEVKKIATMVKSIQHLQILTKLLTNKKPSEKLIIIGMGQKGNLTRFLFPLLNSYITYASFNKIKSAPGQIEIKKLKLFYQQLNQL